MSTNEEENKKENQDETEEYTIKKENLILETHTKINRYLCGDIIVHKKGYVELELTTENEMVVDGMGLIHGGFVFGAADFAAMAAVNEKNVVLVSSQCEFLSPAKIGNIIKVVAQVRHQEGRKRNVHVRAYVHDVKIFEGEFMTVITEKHVLKMKLYEDEEQKK